KTAGQKIVAAPAPAFPQVINLMEALQQSVAQLGAAPAANGKPFKKVVPSRLNHDEFAKRHTRVVAVSVDGLDDSEKTRQSFPHLTVVADHRGGAELFEPAKFGELKTAVPGVRHLAGVPVHRLCFAWSLEQTARVFQVRLPPTWKNCPLHI